MANETFRWEGSPGTQAPPRRAGRLLRALLWFGFKLLIVLSLPFFAFIRGALFLHERHALHVWPSLLAGLILAALVLLGYAAWISRRLTGRWRVPTSVRRLVLVAVGCYATYGIVYLSSVNAKSTEVQSYYRTLHPLLRVAVGTLVLVDRDLVLTDVQRTPEDYESMGLPVNRRSEHFEQDDGYVHAVDLRAAGRPGWRNAAVRLYFAAMGFSTLRHVGTADHLHVALQHRSGDRHHARRRVGLLSPRPSVPLVDLRRGYPSAHSDPA